MLEKETRMNNSKIEEDGSWESELLTREKVLAYPRLFKREELDSVLY